MGEICKNFDTTIVREKCITEKCSCSQCDSLSCFEKRYPIQLCACGNCNKSETCSYYRNNQSCSGTRLSPSDQYTAYLKSANTVTDRNLDEFIEDDRIYESDRQTVLDANIPLPTSVHDYTERLLAKKLSTKLKYKSISLNEYIDKISGKDSKNKQKYMVKLKETKSSATSLQHFETTENSTNGPSESTRICSNHCTRKSKVGNDRNYEMDREIITEANQPPSLNAYIDKISRNSHYKIKKITLDNYVNQLKHAKRSEPFKNIINYRNGNYSESQNSHYKIKQNALDDYVNQLKHAKRSEPFENIINYHNGHYYNSQNSQQKQSTLDEYVNQLKHAKRLEPFENTRHYSNGKYSALISQKKRFNGNYSVSESPKKLKKKCCGLCKKDMYSHAQSAMLSCPLMNFSQPTSKFSDPSLNTSASCKELSVNKSNNYFDIFKKLIDIYKICSCKVCECIGPKIIRNQICTCKPCDCAECSRYVGAINCPSQYHNQSKTHTTKKQADSRVCDHPECPMFQNKETRKPPCPCTDRQNESVRKIPCQSLQRDHSELLRKCTSVPDDYNTKQCTPTRDEGYCYTVNRKNNHGKNMIAMYTSIPPVYPNLYSYNKQSKICDCKQCECIQCKEATASIMKSSNIESAIDYPTNDVCSCKPCECQECTRFLTKYKFEQLHQAAFKPSNSSIYSSYDNGNFYPYRCSLCRSDLYFDDDFVPVSPDIDSRPFKKGDVLTPAAHRAKVQKLMQDKRKLIKTYSGHKKESLLKVSDFYNFQTNKENYRDNSTITQGKKDISTALTKSFHKWNISQCDASVQSVESTINKPELKNNSTNKTLASCTSIFSATETISKASLCKENNIVPPFIGNSNKSSVSSCYSSGPNHCGYVVQFPKSAVASCIEGVLKSGLENDLQLFKFSFDPTKQTNILGTRKVYQASDDENVIGASTSTSTDAKSVKKNLDDIENGNNAININNNVAKSSDLYGFKNLKDNLQIKPIITRSESSNFINSVFRKKSHDECFHMIQSFNQINLARYLNKHNRNEKIIIENDDEVSNLDDYYEKIRKTLNDSKKYTSHLQELLKMYEKENNDFVKISDRLKTTYEPVYNKFKHGNVFVVNRKMPTLQEIPTHKPNFGINENIPVTRDINYNKPSHVLERNNFSKFISEQELINAEYGILEKNVEDKMYKHSNEICYDTPETELSNEKPKNTQIEIIIETASEGFNPVLEHVESNNSNKDDRTLNNEGIERETTDIKKKFDCPMCSVNKKENVCLNPLYVAPKETMTSTSFQTNSSCKPKKKYPNKRNKALKQLQSNVKKLVDMAILHSLNRIDDDSSALDSSSGMSSISKFNLDSEFSNQLFSQPNVQVNKEVWCDNLQLMTELKKQIKEHLQTACMHPLLRSQQSSLCMDNMSASSHSCCESKKVRYLMVQKISEHTALLKWSQPRELSEVDGYELLVDGRTVQKILNPTKCIIAVTCLPHSDKILLTIRTLTSAVSELGHYPASTIIYRPRAK